MKLLPKITYSIESIDSLLKEINPSKVCIVTSKKVVAHAGWALKLLLKYRPEVIYVTDGEQAKEWKELEKILKNFNSLNLDRRALIIILGGGTVGDLVGFAASIYLRGLKYIQIPTTLVSQVDSAHGGKTGINFQKIKNQIGSFHLPAAIIADPRFIKSLSKEQIIDGLGEIIKAGLIRDASILTLLEKYTVNNLAESPDLQTIIKKSIKVKNDVVSKDFKDASVRQLLNAGHTVGHAIELKYGISHGRSVIVGLLEELKVMESLGVTPRDIRNKTSSLLQKMGIVVDGTMKADWESILHDKKINGSQIEIPVIEKEGKAKLMKIDLKRFKQALK